MSQTRIITVQYLIVKAFASSRCLFICPRERAIQISQNDNSEKNINAMEVAR